MLLVLLNIKKREDEFRLLSCFIYQFHTAIGKKSKILK
ncbi:hypothetical protein STRCR_0806 [Streptococcus criceti HS-6]|uniref:Uncharacterized protein n=1 Tax=Streptococcus criceti HS-6 TaxID=873449 RepID=G5JRU8_STRCG|nr:hypothetical protein STRCR_0806 [Streptococcus criceti HS-6]